MGKLDERVAYVAAFRSAATQLNTYKLAGEWHELGIAAQDAAAWASAGFLPQEAAPLIAAGVDVQTASDVDAALVAEHGVIGAALLKLELEHGQGNVIVSPWADEGLPGEQ